MTDPIDWNRLARYIAGEATAAEKADVERWSASAPERQAVIASVGRQWRAAAHPQAWDVDAAWKRLAAQLATAQPSVEREIVSLDAARRHSWSATKRLLPLAAVIVVVAGLTLIWRSQRSRTAGSLGGPVAVGVTESHTGIGERRTLGLADGSSVILGAASVLRVSGEVNDERHVYLDGQALFRIRHDAARPFIVHARGTVARDLGTEFEVRAYPGDAVVRVAVKEGAVAVRGEQAAGDSAVLGPRDVARLTEKGTPVVLHDQNVDRLVAWTNGEIIFDDTPLSDVAKELERWFDIECRIADPSLEKLHLTTPFSSGESLEAVLGVIAKSLELRVQRSGRVVTFTRGPTRAAAPPSPATIDNPRRTEAGA